ncbi:MAG: YdbL family protein [candidate division KSB1 bacterium]|nr:YdbL family protein [candidate division KSB1 bacterium]
MRPSEKLETDPEYKKLVLQLLEVENRDREIIMNRVLEVNDEAAKAGKEEVYAIFARMNQESAENGTWIQLPDGSWVKKGQAK